MYVLLALAVLFYIWARRQARRDRSASTSAPSGAPSRYPSMSKRKRTGLRAEEVEAPEARASKRKVERAAIATALHTMLMETADVAFHGVRKAPAKAKAQGTSDSLDK